MAATAAAGAGDVVATAPKDLVSRPAEVGACGLAVFEADTTSVVGRDNAPFPPAMRLSATGPESPSATARAPPARTVAGSNGAPTALHSRDTSRSNSPIRWPRTKATWETAIPANMAAAHVTAAHSGIARCARKATPSPIATTTIARSTRAFEGIGPAAEARPFLPATDSDCFMCGSRKLSLNSVPIDTIRPVSAFSLLRRVAMAAAALSPGKTCNLTPRDKLDAGRPQNRHPGGFPSDRHKRNGSRLGRPRCHPDLLPIRQLERRLTRRP